MTLFPCILLLLCTCSTFSLSPNFGEIITPISLVISVYDVSVHGVEIDWHFKDESVKGTLSCELIYGPVDDVSQVQVFTRIQLSEENVIKLSHLDNNVTYHMHMVCSNGTEEKIHSNALQFTTGSRSVPLNYVMPPNVFRGVFSSRDEDLSQRSVRSSSVILGGLCGLVGFVIINVTIVMAVRRYSLLQLRRRRILQIEEQNYDEFPYLRGEE